MKYLVYLLLFLIIALKSSSQELSIKDCKLTFDNIPFNDSCTITITRDEFLKMKRLRTSFSWAKIKSFSAYITCLGCKHDMADEVQCNSDSICSNLERHFEIMPFNMVIKFDAIVTNRQGLTIPWQKLWIVVK